MKIPFLSLRKQLRSIEEEIKREVLQVIDSCDYILSSKVSAFENQFARYLSIDDTVATSNGLDALRIALLTLDLEDHHEIILPANTFIATALAVSSTKGKIVLVDCDENNYNIDCSKIESAITQNTKAIIPVHLTGQSADLDPILALARKYNLYVIEDAAQAVGTKYKGQTCGTIGDFGCFSFYPGKNLGAYGDAGLLCARNPDHVEKIKMLRNYGQTSKYYHEVKGYNCRMDEIQAAVLSVKLKHLDQWNTKRNEIAQLYTELLSNVEQIKLPKKEEYSTHNYHLFIIRTERRNALKDFLSEKGITTLIHYPIPIHLQNAYAKLDYKKGDFPVAEKLANTFLSLPMFAELTIQEVKYISDQIKIFYA